MRTIDTVSAINQSSNFNSLTVTINDIDITPELIMEITLDVEDFNIYGNITFNDNYNIHTEGKLELDSTVIITIIDLYDDFFSREFNILKVAEEKVQDSKILKLSLQDTVSFTLEKTYKCKSYAETSLTDILNDYLALEVDSLVSGFPFEKNLKATPKFKNFCVPGHINFLSFIKTECDKQGIYLTQDLFGIQLNVTDDIKGKYPYKQVGSNDTYGFNIIDYRLLSNNTQESMKTPVQDWIVFDKDKKNMKHYYTDFNKDKETFNFGGVAKDLQFNMGKQLKTKEYLTDDMKYKLNALKNTNILSIIVPGNLKQNIMYSTVDINLSGNIFSNDSKFKGDEKLSGTYQIFRIETKILIGQKMVNKLTLKRTFEGKTT